MRGDSRRSRLVMRDPAPRAASQYAVKQLGDEMRSHSAHCESAMLQPLHALPVMDGLFCTTTVSMTTLSSLPLRFVLLMRYVEIWREVTRHCADN